MNELFLEIKKMNAEDSLNEEAEEQKDSIEDYQKAIEELNLEEPKGHEITKDIEEPETADLEGELAEVPAVHQVDAEDIEIHPEDQVAFVLDKTRVGVVETVGELIEVNWGEDNVTLEYPEALVHAHSEVPDEDLEA
jgi:hypothetical protein